MNRKCQVFTPQEIANQMLDLANYHKKLFGKKVLESACGEGDLLAYIVERYIIDCLNHNIEISMIKHGLERDIFGYDIDKAFCETCCNRLDKLSHKYGIKNVEWNIHDLDSLRCCPTQHFDFVFGNPPYISYRELNENDRNDLRIMYLSCIEGSFDYCYAFIEHDLSCLKEKGKLVYLVPSSIFKNVHGEKLRKIIHPFITDIIDFTTKKLFGSVLTSSAILVCEKGKENKTIHYTNAATDESGKIDKESLLTKQKWIFSFNNETGQEGSYKFSDYFSVSIVIATLLNEAFILQNAEENEHGYLISDLHIEKEVVRPAASPRALRYNREEYIIFPYCYSNGIKRYSENDFRTKFPGAVKHLEKYYEKLKQRDSDRNCKWFEYGRSQALSTIHQEKLLLSRVVTNKVQVYRLPNDTIPYSGLYIYSKGAVSLDVATKILQSEEFIQYVRNIGIYASGESIRITCDDIENFKFSEGFFENGQT